LLGLAYGNIMAPVVPRSSLWLCALVIPGLALLPLAVAAQTPKTPRASAARAAPAPTKAVMPGFETLPDGSTRLFITLSGPVSYETRSDHGSTAYVLKATRVARQNNCNPLVTEYFNTPVTTARLVPHVHDLWLVTETRAAVAPTVSLDTETDGGATFSVRFPKGDYLPPEVAAPQPVEVSSSDGSEAAPAATSAPSAAPSARPVPSGRGRGGGSGGGRGRSGHRSHGAAGTSGTSGTSGTMP
jgi:hypothetical protein